MCKSVWPLNKMKGNLEFFASLKGRQVDHQSTMAEIKGKILSKPISILIDQRAFHS